VSRLLGASPVVAAAGILGLLVSIATYGPGLGRRAPAYPVGKAEIVERARAFATAAGRAPSDWLAVAEPVFKQRDRLDKRLGVDEVRGASLSGTLPVEAWAVRFRDQVLFSRLEADPGGIALTLSETGEILSARFHEPTPEAPAPGREEARLIAAEHLVRLGFDPSAYAEEGAGGPPTHPAAEPSEQGAAREQRFVWKRPDPSRLGVAETLTATVTASGLTRFARDVDVERNVQTSEEDQLPTWLELTITIAFVLLPLLVLGLAVARLVTRNFISVRRALVLGAAFMASALVSYAAAERLTEPIALLYAARVFFLLWLPALVVACAWLVGEVDGYLALGPRATEGMVAVLSGRLAVRRVAREVLEGYCWGWAFLGVLLAAAVVGATAGADAIHLEPRIAAFEYHPSWLFVLKAVPETLGLAVVAYAFALPWALRLLKRSWLAVSVAAIPTALLAMVSGVQDGLSSVPIVWTIPFALASCALVMRRGILTATSGAFAFFAFYDGIPLLFAGSPWDVAAGGLGLGLAALPVIAAFALGPHAPDIAVVEAPPRLDRYLKEARHYEELKIAYRVQERLLPAEAPPIDGLDVAGVCLPAREIGGDYFDYFPRPDGRFGIAVGDVSGKGVPAAFFMALTKGYMEMAAEANEPVAVLGRVNGFLRRRLTKSTFVTMVYAVYDPESRTLTCASAGHNPPLLVRRGAQPEFLTVPGVALGAATSERFGSLARNVAIPLERGDTIIFYTDGVTEARNTDLDEFGEERLVSALSETDGAVTARGLADGLVACVNAFRGAAEQHDDVTVVVVKVT
jgi:hypothetical protein